ncbi:MAG: ABC transporter ATP-binding protein [Porticoccaceae bacterium]|jgi:putative ABC transport system ATP-binding protein
MAIIELRAVDKTYLMGGEPLRALRNLNVDIDAGEYISIMGPSGSGKSTLLNMIGLLDRPDNGSYMLDSVATEHLDEERRAALRRDNIGFIFQAFHLINRLTAYENVELPMVLAGIPAAKRRQAVADVIDMVGLGDRIKHRPGQLSGGQLQRVAIARAIVMKPKILLADEPTGNLDQASGQDIVEVIERLNGEGITLIVVTHDLSLGERARRRIRMVDGAIATDTGL